MKSKIKRAPYSRIYGQPLLDLLDVFAMGEQVRRPIYLYVNAFMAEYKKGFMTEYAGQEDPERIADEEKDKYGKFRDAVMREVAGLTREELPPERDFFYVLRAALRRHKKGSRQHRISHTLDARTRTQINMELIRRGFDGNGRFRTMGYAYDIIEEILAEYGIRAKHVTARDVHRSFGYKMPEGVVRFEMVRGEEDIKNSLLFISWTEMESYDVEVVAYMS